MVKKKVSHRKKLKRHQKVIFIIVIVFLSLGLIGSSVVWISGNSFLPPEKEEQAYPPETIANLEARAKENPKDATTTAQLARAYLDAGRSKEALDTYEKAISLNPDNSTVRVEMALAYFFSGQYEKAINHLEEEIKRHPQNKEAHYYLGQVLVTAKNDYKRGIGELEEFIKLAKTGDDVIKARQMIEEWKKKIPANDS